MSLFVRRATVLDAETVAEFNRRLAWESEGKKLDAEVLRHGVAAVLADAHKGFYVMAEREGEVIGQSMVTFEWSDWRNGWYWWVQSVYVREDARRLGVFRAIFEQLKTEAMADPTVIGIRLYVERENERAHKVYRAVGMEEEPYFLYGMYPLPGKESAIG